ncbi:MAG: outer membrane lipoprotein-sorting protein [Verrucomicrobiae bacterium]|nr:outer membrane lipoprotein-sorting protein [Verrucomicrobiae bacterium]NNJ43996.1 outer membrane lipoprotein-sorting protein [Akkermansiaceae bacterium]
MTKVLPAAGCFVLMAIGLLCSATLVRADDAAERLLESVRYGATLQKSRLEGHLRKDGKRTPLTLTMMGENISFQFYTQKKWSGFHMQMKQGEAKLFETLQGKAVPFPAKKIGQAVLGSDVTYEDLSLRFLYWKDATIIGQEKIKMQHCHKIRLRNPGQDGRYSLVYIWVHQKFGALMQVAGYNRNGQLLKRFHVTELMTVKKVQTLKKMNVETYKPGTNKVTGVTYLEFKEAKRRGL